MEHNRKCIENAAAQRVSLLWEDVLAAALLFAWALGYPLFVLSLERAS